MLEKYTVNITERTTGPMTQLTLAELISQQKQTATAAWLKLHYFGHVLYMEVWNKLGMAVSEGTMEGK